MFDYVVLLQLLEDRSQLPVWSSQDHILQTIANTPVTVIRGETGCGKTTQVSAKHLRVKVQLQILLLLIYYEFCIWWFAIAFRQYGKSLLDVGCRAYVKD